jgi:hypothetical protein
MFEEEEEKPGFTLGVRIVQLLFVLAVAVMTAVIMLA